MAKGAKVEWYANGLMDVAVNFPNGEVACKWCPFLKDEIRMRYRCQMTQQILYAPDRDVGCLCPLQIEYPVDHQPARKQEEST